MTCYVNKERTNHWVAFATGKGETFSANSLRFWVKLSAWKLYQPQESVFFINLPSFVSPACTGIVQEFQSIGHSKSHRCPLYVNEGRRKEIGNQHLLQCLTYPLSTDTFKVFKAKYMLTFMKWNRHSCICSCGHSCNVFFP